MKKESRVSGVRAPATAAKEYGAVKPMLCGRGFLADQVLLNTEQGVVQIFDVAKVFFFVLFFQYHFLFCSLLLSLFLIPFHIKIGQMYQRSCSLAHPRRGSW